MFQALKAQQDAHESPLPSIGFELELRPSKIQVPNAIDTGSHTDDDETPVTDAGMGVFVKSSGDNTRDTTPVIFPGTVLAIFPGLVHLNEPLPLTSPTKSAMTLSSVFDFNKTIGVKDEYIHRELLPDPNYQLLMRLDGVFIDSRKACTAPDLLNNPYALAHRINHPPVDTDPPTDDDILQRAQAPNVVQLRYDFLRSSEDAGGFPHDLTPFIPNQYAVQPQFPWLINRSVLMHSSLVIACSYIKPGDELYVDYRLGPDLPASMVPPWYRHVDVEGARSRLSSSPRNEEGDGGDDADSAVDVSARGVSGNEWATPFPVPFPDDKSNSSGPGTKQSAGPPGRPGTEERKRLKVVR
mgnify:CR=1 FL=1